MSKIIATKKTNALFLAVILVVGTFALMPSSLMGGTAQAEPGYGMNYEKKYGYDKSYNDKPKYPSYNQYNYYKSKDSSISIKKVDCNNVNLNVNDASVNVGRPPVVGDFTTLESSGTDDQEITANNFANGDRFNNNNNGFKKDKDGFVYVCINNNNNEQIEETPPSPPPTPCEVTVDTITEGIGDNPVVIAYDPVNDRMYVTNSNDGTVSVIDTTTNTVIDTDPSTTEIDPITVGNFPWYIAYDSENERMYVTNDADGTVSVIDTTTNTVIDTITVGNSPIGIIYDSENERMYVANNVDGTVSVIDTTTNTVIGDPITVAGQPEGITYGSTTLDVYVANFIGNTVSVIDTTTNTVIGDPIEVGQNPAGIAFDPVNDRVYVANFGEDTVSVINLC